MTLKIFKRAVMVACDRCRARCVIRVAAATPQSEARWDDLVVAQLHQLGWQAGIEPSAIGRRAVPDICPDCKKKGRL